MKAPYRSQPTSLACWSSDSFWSRPPQISRLVIPTNVHHTYHAHTSTGPACMSSSMFPSVLRKILDPLILYLDFAAKPYNFSLIAQSVKTAVIPRATIALLKSPMPQKNMAPSIPTPLESE